MEWGKGLVQREEEQARKKRMEEEKFKPLARYKDDEELNEELKDRDRWNDPAAMFLTGVKKSKKTAPKFPLYQGNFPPNRYNIRPGYRWDGVDRSNGFEKDYFMVCVISLFDPTSRIYCWHCASTRTDRTSFSAGYQIANEHQTAQCSGSSYVEHRRHVTAANKCFVAAPCSTSLPFFFFCLWNKHHWVCK